MSSSRTDVPRAPRSSTSRCPRWASRWPRARRRLARRGRRPDRGRATTICEISTDKIDTEVPSPVDRGRRRDPGAGRRDGRRRDRAGPDRRRSAGAWRRAGAEARPPTAAAAPAPVGRRARPQPSPAAGGPHDRQAARPPVLPGRPADRRRARHRLSRGARHRTRRTGPQAGRAGVRGVDGGAPRPTEPPLHIESPYRPDPEPAAPAPAAAATAASCRGCAGRSAST